MRGWLRELRYEKGLTQLDVAQCAGISRSYYTQIELKGSGKSPSVQTAKDIARVLEFNWHDFFEDERTAAN